MDFTVKKYEVLLNQLLKAGYSFQTFEQFIQRPKERVIVLRHDVDLLPENSLAFAKIQAHLNVKGVYYFRAVPESWDVDIIKEISLLGHEIGYHYECLTTCNGNLKEGIKDFETHLQELRKLAPVTTICMHGSPMSKYDSKELWRTYDYRKYGIIGEPYFDVDFNQTLYLTDTGRRWDGDKVSVRDRVNTLLNHTFHSTSEIIESARTGQLPDKILFTFHPQRWNDSWTKWIRELTMQNIKNIVKRLLFVKARA